MLKNGDDCPVCKGKGEVDCEYCHGTGSFTMLEDGIQDASQTCFCKDGKKKCPSCKGSGVYHKE